jgi:hypothetical protein
MHNAIIVISGTSRSHFLACEIEIVYGYTVHILSAASLKSHIYPCTNSSIYISFQVLIYNLFIQLSGITYASTVVNMITVSYYIMEKLASYTMDDVSSYTIDIMSSGSMD